MNYLNLSITDMDNTQFREWPSEIKQENNAVTYGGMSVLDVR